MQPLAKFAAFLIALAAVIGTANEAPAGSNWTREQVLQREAAVLARARGLNPTEKLEALPITPMIIGGIKSPPNRWPFQAGLLRASESNNFQAQFCGGSVIDKEFILTAAHCVEGLIASDLHILTGTQSLGNGGTRREVRRIRMHPAYNPTTFDYDIALVQLKTKITDIAPAHMAVVITREQEPVFAEPSTKSVVTGWGDTTGNDTFGVCVAPSSGPNRRTRSMQFRRIL